MKFALFFFKLIIISINKMKMKIKIENGLDFQGIHNNIFSYPIVVTSTVIDHTPSNFLKAAFHKFDLVHS